MLLGEFLALVDYGIVSGRFDIIMHEHSIIDAVQELAKTLKRVNKQVKPEFIRHRIERIAKKHAGKLTPRQKQLISEISAILS